MLDKAAPGKLLGAAFHLTTTSMYRNIFLLALGCALIGACQKVNNFCGVCTYDTQHANYSRTEPTGSDEFELVNTPVLSAILIEASGVVSGRKNPGWVYLHEDSGNRNVVFVYDTLANFVGEIVLVGIQNRDWEDIAIGPGPVAGETYLYVADFGDNSGSRHDVMIHRLPEPVVPQSDEPFKLLVEDFETITYQYPDGPRDAETLMIDPKTADLYVISKRDVMVQLYQLPFPQCTEGLATICFTGVLPFKTIVGGDISPNGDEILIKDYGRIYHWKGTADGITETMVSTIPHTVAYVPEVQGEAVGWTHNGDGYFTISEIKRHLADLILYHYRR